VTTPRESLAALLAIPYWTVVVILDVAVGSAVAGWWAVGAWIVVGAAAMGVWAMIRDRCAGWVWRHVEILADGWRQELARTAPDKTLTSGNGADNAEVER
jgi:type VI protein secretion system component VasK